MRAVLVLSLALLIGPGAGCSWVRTIWPFAGGPAAPRGDPSFGIEVVSSEAVVDFYERAVFFYSRLARRRFNTLATFRDELLRDFFRSETAFSDTTQIWPRRWRMRISSRTDPSASMSSSSSSRGPDRLA